MSRHTGKRKWHFFKGLFLCCHYTIKSKTKMWNSDATGLKTVYICLCNWHFVKEKKRQSERTNDCQRKRQVFLLHALRDFCCVYKNILCMLNLFQEVQLFPWDISLNSIETGTISPLSFPDVSKWKMFSVLLFFVFFPPRYVRTTKENLF